MRGELGLQAQGAQVLLDVVRRQRPLVQTLWQQKGFVFSIAPLATWLRLAANTNKATGKAGRTISVTQHMTAET